MPRQTNLDGYKPIAQSKRSEQSERIDIAPSALRTCAATVDRYLLSGHKKIRYHKVITD